MWRCVITSISNRQRSAISGHPLPERTDFGSLEPWSAARQAHVCPSQPPLTSVCHIQKPRPSDWQNSSGLQCEVAYWPALARMIWWKHEQFVGAKNPDTVRVSNGSKAREEDEELAVNLTEIRMIQALSQEGTWRHLPPPPKVLCLPHEKN